MLETISPPEIKQSLFHLKLNKFMKKHRKWNSLDRLFKKLIRIMKLTSFLILVFVISVSAASSYSQSTKLNIQVTNGTFVDVLKQIENQSEFYFYYNNDEIQNIGGVSISMSDKQVEEVLDHLLKGTNLEYQIIDRYIALKKKDSSEFDLTKMQQQKSVAGKVTDSSGATLPGVSVVVKGTTNGCITDIDGNYALSNVPGNATLQFSFVGMRLQEVAVGDKTSIDVTLEVESVDIEEVVAIGYGVQKKKLTTGSTIQVKGEEIQRMNSVSPISAIQSMTPGVNITKKSGQPGDGFKVVIRGIGTTGNSDPLYVVDGVTRGNIDYLAPSDIESIDILKDAASAAIYGARAFNGVVLVTTKKGKESNKMTLTYDGSYGVQNVYKMLPLLDAKGYMVIQNEANVNSGLKPYDWASLLAPGYYEKLQNGTWHGPSWLKEMENKNASVQSHAFNISGGNNVSVYSAGFSYTSQEGIFGKPVQSTYDRYTFRINSEHTIIKKSWDVLKIGENVSYTFAKNHGIATGNMWSNNIYNMIQTDPLLPMSATDATDVAYPYHYSIPWNTLASNPVAGMIYGQGFNENKNHSLNANVYLTLQPIKGLIYRSSFSTSPNFNSYRSWNPTYALGPNNTATTNSVTQNMSGGYGWTFENTLNYEFSIKDTHNFNVLAGTSAERWGLGEEAKISNKNSVFDDFEHAYIDNANVNSTATINGAPWNKGGILSYFGRLNYDYKEKYLLTLVMRADGSSNFSKGNRWGYFPSVSSGWVASSESFMESTRSFMDFLKIRASWGQNGNQNIPPFQYISLVTFNDPSNNVFSNYYFGSSKITPSLGAFPKNLPTPDLKWETSEQLDLGFDARFLNSKLSLTFDYYKKTTKDWLVAAPILASWGVQSAPYINGGEVQNTGIEVALGYNDKAGEFTYGVNANMSYNKNEVTRIDNEQGIINATNVKLWGNGTYFSRAEVGKPIGYFYGYKTNGIFQNTAEVAAYKNEQGVVIMPTAKPGDVRFVDTDLDGAITEADKVQIGDPNPDVILSVNLNCAYKGFDLSVNTYGVLGNQIARNWHDAGSSLNNYTTEILNRWHGEGTSNKIPRLTSGSSINQTFNSDLSIENGDYLRISNVTLGYDLKKLAKSLPFEQLRIFITGQNLYTFTKYSGMDPEIGTSTDDSNWGWVKGVDLGFYPNLRTLMVGASIKF